MLEVGNQKVLAGGFRRCREVRPSAADRDLFHSGWHAARMSRVPAVATRRLLVKHDRRWSVAQFVVAVTAARAEFQLAVALEAALRVAVVASAVRRPASPVARPEPHPVGTVGNRVDIPVADIAAGAFAAWEHPAVPAVAESCQAENTLEARTPETGRALAGRALVDRETAWRVAVAAEPQSAAALLVKRMACRQPTFSVSVSFSWVCSEGQSPFQSATHRDGCRASKPC